MCLKWDENTLPVCTGLWQCSNATCFWECGSKCLLGDARFVRVFKLVSRTNGSVRAIESKYLGISRNQAVSLRICYPQEATPYISTTERGQGIVLDGLWTYTLRATNIQFPKNSILGKSTSCKQDHTPNMHTHSSESGKRLLRTLGPKEWSGDISSTLLKTHLRFTVIFCDWFAKGDEHNSAHLDGVCEAQLGQGRKNYSE